MMLVCFGVRSCMLVDHSKIGATEVYPLSSHLLAKVAAVIDLKLWSLRRYSTLQRPDICAFPTREQKRKVASQCRSSPSPSYIDPMHRICHFHPSSESFSTSLMKENKATMAQSSARCHHQYAVSSTRSSTCFAMTVAVGLLSANSHKPLPVRPTSYSLRELPREGFLVATADIRH